jgi:hypothetical protein
MTETDPMTYSHPRPWEDKHWVEVGDRVTFIGYPDGRVYIQRVIDGETANFCGGARGVVVEPPSGGYPPHPCPDHDSGDCVCGDREDATVPGKPTSAVVAWEYDNGATHRALIYARDGGTRWSTVGADDLARELRAIEVQPRQSPNLEPTT